MDYEAQIIHLPTATDRDTSVKALQDFFTKSKVVAASDGVEWEALATIGKRHIHPNTTVTRGMLGCAHSHIQLLHEFLKSGKEERLIIVEDDCEFLYPYYTVLGEVFTSLRHEWDLYLYGANEYVEATPVSYYCSHVKRFWGTHAMVITKKAARAALKVWAEAQKEGVFLPVDWMWNEAIRKEGLKCLGPIEPKRLCRQREGLVSAITGTVRMGAV